MSERKVIDLGERARRLQKVIELCVSTLNNLAYYRSGWDGDTRLFDGRWQRQVKNNFWSMTYIEWCKLFGNRNEAHHWREIITDDIGFKDGLLKALAMSDEQYKIYQKQMTEIRNKSIAHQDIFDELEQPHFDGVIKSIKYLINYIYNNELNGIALQYRYNPDTYYDEVFKEGRIYWNLRPEP